MKYFLPALLICLGGCASSYQAMNTTGGYQENKIADHRWQVAYEGRPSSDPVQIRDYAVLRSAELCMEQGYSRFDISSVEDTSRVKIHRYKPFSGSGNTLDSCAATNGVTPAGNTITRRYVIPSAVLTVSCSNNTSKGEVAISQAAAIREQYGLPGMREYLAGNVN